MNALRDDTCKQVNIILTRSKIKGYIFKGIFPTIQFRIFQICVSYIKV
jgi:hypothetical protein